MLASASTMTGRILLPLNDQRKTVFGSEMPLPYPHQSRFLANWAPFRMLPGPLMDTSFSTPPRTTEFTSGSQTPTARTHFSSHLRITTILIQRYRETESGSLLFRSETAITRYGG